MKPGRQAVLAFLLFGAALTLDGPLISGEFGVCVDLPGRLVCSLGVGLALVGGLLLFLRAVY